MMNNQLLRRKWTWLLLLFVFLLQPACKHPAADANAVYQSYLKAHLQKQVIKPGLNGTYNGHD